jgi:8-oxo-dGTP pyrophosphatase MutT (NUDIX family)
MTAKHERSLARIPFFIGRQRAGSVATQHVNSLLAWPAAISVQAHAVRLRVPVQARDATLAAINSSLHQQGLVQGWRDELFAVPGLHGGQHLANLERAASRFWGTLTLAAHLNAYVADTHGQPTHLWLAQRSASKSTDPGLWDNLVAGGVPTGQTPQQALVREAWEEAGLLPAQLRGAGTRANAGPDLDRPTLLNGPVMRVQRAVAQGWQLEDIHCFDLRLPAAWQPTNQDGEVQAFECVPIKKALALAASALMTADASAVTLNFARRFGLT